MATEMLALPSGETSATARGRNALSVAVVGIAAGGAMVVGALVAAYLSLRSSAPGDWLAEDITFDNYTATMLLITGAMTVVTIEWAAYALRTDLRGQALAALAITLGLGLAFLNGLWYLVSGFSFEPGSSAYATVAYAMSIVAGLYAALGFGFVLLTTLRAVGHQLTSSNTVLMRATALYWHFVIAAWTAVYYTLYVAK